MLHNIQDEFTKEAAHLWDLHLVLSILAEQFHLFLAVMGHLNTNNFSFSFLLFFYWSLLLEIWLQMPPY